MTDIDRKARLAFRVLRVIKDISRAATSQDAEESDMFMQRAALDFVELMEADYEARIAQEAAVNIEIVPPEFKVHIHEGNTSDDRSTLTNYQVEEIAIQAAHFYSCIPNNKDWIDFDRLNGRAGLLDECYKQAVAFYAHHWPLDAAEDSYWDRVDWYLCTDDWYDKHMVPSITRGDQS